MSKPIKTQRSIIKMSSNSIQAELAEIFQELSTLKMHFTEHVSIRGRTIKLDSSCCYCLRFQEG